MGRLGRFMERVVHGTLLGGVVGLVIGVTEWLVLSRGLAFANSVTAYAEIVRPHVVAGLGIGVPVGVVAALLSAPGPGLAPFLAGLWSALPTLALLAYAMADATFRLGRPVLKPSNLVVYAGSLVAAVALAYLLRRALGALFARLERRRAPHPALRLGLPIAMAVVLLVGLGVHSALPRQASLVPTAAAGFRPVDRSPQRPNVVFVLVDATRADHLSLYGYSRETDPNITALARTGMTFTRMYAQASATRGSVATIFTSLYPAVHKSNDDRDFLSSSLPRLPEVLKVAGYRTFGLSANANVSPTFGYSKGFDEFRVWKTESPFRLTLAGRVADVVLGPPRLSRLLGEHSDIVPDAASITDVALRWASAQRGGDPVFMYVHYIDPHDPYSPPAPYNEAFDYRRDPPRREHGTVDPLALLAPGQDRAAVGRTLDQYDGEIRYADHHVGRLLKGLGELGVLDDALVILTADHGEEFLEHGQETHGRSAYEEVLRVPFVMSWPGHIPAGATYAGMVGLIDVMPTLADLLHVAPPRLVQGLSFAPVLAAPATAVPPRTFYAQVLPRGFGIEMVRDGRYKFVHHTYGPRQNQEEFYDLEADPLERNPLPLGYQAARLRKDLGTFNQVIRHAVSLTGPEQVKALDKDTERALRSLGYIK